MYKITKAISLTTSFIVFKPEYEPEKELML